MTKILNEIPLKLIFFNTTINLARKEKSTQK